MKKIVLSLFLMVIAFGLSAKTAVIYHTSDTHGFFYPKNGQGGFAALAAVLRQEKNPYLLVDAGDFAEGTAETKNSKGIKAVQLMNKLHYQAATIGNHEFAYYDDGLENMLKQAQFSILAANFFEADSYQRPAFVKPYQVFTVNGIKIAVIGLANRTPTKATKKYTFTKPLDALEQALAQPEVKQADVVVVLAHDSLADDRPESPFYLGDIARKYGQKVQIVLGGHAHKVFTNQRLNGVLYNEVGYYLKSVGKITIDVDDKTRQITSIQAQLIPLTISKTGEDKKIKQYAESLREPGLEKVLGTLAQPLPAKAVAPAQDSVADDWVADIGRSYTKADVFISNVGGVRTGLAAGPVTKRDLLDFFPFDDTLVSMNVDGRFIKQLVKKTLLPRNLLAYSGLTVTYKKNKKNQPKQVKILINGKPVENRKKYTLATNSFLARGKHFQSIDSTDKQAVGQITMWQLIEEALAKQSVSVPAAGRVIQLP
ncbi:MAG: bifunctional metallophosphatase/5'-nucleotidase [Elusimicrobiaceae bacterium]|nr:bifunctional metallophosphatase/5'-nucleotidase [Elusimicrobiaceae bacterium]